MSEVGSRANTHRRSPDRGACCPWSWKDIADPERLAEVADAIIDCDSDAELFARMGM